MYAFIFLVEREVNVRVLLPDKRYCELVHSGVGDRHALGSSSFKTIPDFSQKPSKTHSKQA